MEASTDNFRHTIEELIRIGSEVAKAGQSVEIEVLVQKVTIYLDKFELWQQSFGQSNPLADISDEAQRQELRSLVEQLGAQHQKILEIVNSHKVLVASEMGNLHRRGKALKSYLDKYPSRVTIAGKRTG